MIIGSAHPLEKSAPGSVVASIHNLTLGMSILGVRPSLPQKTVLVTVAVTFGRRWYCRVVG